MKRTMKHLFIAVAVSGALATPHAVLAAAPSPTLQDDNPAGSAGDWFVGATPPNADPSKPVILFVQGLNSNIGTWTQADGYYEAAYNQGYRTAFVHFQDATGPGGSMWTNGQILAGVINKVRAYYGVDKVNIVAHSKGGIDTNTALVHYGAAPYVNVVHQVATPNLGSGLADVAYTSWAGWLAGLIGQQSDATYSLQTSYMANFRAQTDGLAANGLTRTYLSAGTGNDGYLSMTFFGQGILSPYESDGAVTVPSAYGYPHGVVSFKDNGLEKLSHGAIVLASKTWKYVQPKLTTASYAGLSTGMTAAKGSLFLPEAAPEVSNTILRGGAVNGSVQDSFELESKLGQVSVDVMTSSHETNVRLVSPSGKVYEPKQTVGGTANGEAIFGKATHNNFEIQSPEQGSWTLQLDGDSDGYFMVANIEGGAKAAVKGSKKVMKGHNKTLDLALSLNGAQASLDKSSAKLTKATKQGKVQKLAGISLRQDSQGALLANFATPTEPGVYNVSFDVVGVNADGESFTRTVTYNFAVTDENGKL